MSTTRPRKRDKFLTLFSRGSSGGGDGHSHSRTPSLSPARATPSPPLRSPSPRSQSPHPQPRAFSEPALQSLPPDDLALVRRHVAGRGRGDVDAAVRAAYEGAVRQRERCEARRWRVRFRGREVVVAEEAGRVVGWVRRFAAVGDVVANVDPVHVGLPWAGIRLILQVAGAGAEQVAALLAGLNLSMYMANRLRAYSAYLARLPDTDATLTFEKALVRMYALVLRFLDEAVACAERGSVARIWDAVWSEATLDGFEKKCNAWAMHVALDVVNCDRELAQRNELDAREWREQLQGEVQTLDESLRGVHDSLALLHTKNDLAKLQTVPRAVYDSLDENRLARCLPGTRTALLRQILDWAGDPGGKRIFWLCGMAGTGKSAVARTIAHMLDQQRRLGSSFCVGVSFFFKRGEGDRGSADRFYSTIAMQLTDTIPGLGSAVADAVDKDSFLSTRDLEVQFEQLIIRPLRRLRRETPGRWHVIIVLDALDECERRGDISALLTQLAQIETDTSVSLRIFVTSRPELPIQLKFESMPQSLHEDIRLEVVQADTIEHDIRAYLEHEFGDIKAEMIQRRPYDDLDADWPGGENLDKLVKLAVPLFIFASTVCRFVADDRPDYNPTERLQSILQNQKDATHSELEKTYLPILDRVVLGKEPKDREARLGKFRDVVGPIVLLASPLSVPMLSNLLDTHPSNVHERLENLHSVLRIPKDRDLPVQLLHLSFRDFLVSSENQDGNPFWIDPTHAHKKLSLQCLRLLGQPRGLKQDICGLANPASRRTDLSKTRMEEYVPADMRYACSFWVYHLAESGVKICDGGPVHEFLETYLLCWVEALSWLGRFSDALSNIKTLMRLVEFEKGARLLSFLLDAYKFLFYNRDTIDSVPLQMYSSALIFAEEDSIIREIFTPKHPTSWLQALSDLSLGQSAENEAQPSEDSSADMGYKVTFVVFSPDGQKLASVYVELVRLWDVATGTEARSLETYDDAITAVAFSPDAETLVTASGHGMVRLWDTESGEHLHGFQGHQGGIIALMFSHDGRMLASGSMDETARLWSLETGEEMLSFPSYNPSDKLAFALDDMSLQIGTECHDLRAHIQPSPSVETQQMHHLLTINGPWIKSADQKLLRLPYEYSGNRADVYGDTLAIGRAAGDVSFYRFDESKLVKTDEPRESQVIEPFTEHQRTYPSWSG